ncbi:hypothetical protein [Moorena sp. SIO3I6]|nr:hypothetical protein [Moorena sp. SIO3I6]
MAVGHATRTAYFIQKLIADIAILNQLRECLFPVPYSLFPVPFAIADS